MPHTPKIASARFVTLRESMRMEMSATNVGAKHKIP